MFPENIQSAIASAPGREGVASLAQNGHRAERFSRHFVTRMRVWTAAILAMGFCAAGCGVSFAPLPAGSAAGRIATYDYSPTVIQSGNLQQVWWCGGGYNPAYTPQWSDTIQYESTDLSTHAHQGPLTVLGETPGAWDSVFTCNPKVVQGIFVNPLGNGKTYTYALYYVGLGSTPGSNNYIGVAFSNDGIAWKKISSANYLRRNAG